MQKKWVLCALTTLAVGAAEAKSVEYECDQGGSQSGYRIRVVELSRDLQEVIVLKKSNGSASVVADKKLKRVRGSANGNRFESNQSGHRMSFKKTNADSDGNWVGIFTIAEKRGPQIVQASCGRVETLTL